MAFATSEPSARVGRGFFTIDSNICVAQITGFPTCKGNIILQYSESDARS